ncbi:TVP38/TMEM64 family protein [Jannaschia donghaensis]|uniref:TVP38/TMEM64 family membrane protein n=1 Tax=Jannaschia donghaensis TaxID=420998 RepID=A0A0M6YKS8_9RHOB|nr:TVP38/TMEM64 family protein [Jannaschia donghaensis]CTQ50275.1 TVP38/TMEM64 family inner membrane protein YdjZ [Jannaschia donghaensis]
MTVPSAPTDPALKAWHIWLWPVLLVVIAFAMWLLPWADWVPILRDWVQSHGPLGAFVFIAVYVVVVILPLPAAAMSVVGGLAFGWWGYPLSMLGSLLGAIAPYYIARHWLRGPMMRRIDGPKVRAADRAITENGFVFVALLRLTPILPFTAQNWLLGLTEIRPWPYFAATLVGLAPGTLAMVWIGEMGGLASVSSDRTQIVLAAGGLLAFGSFVIWLGRIATKEMQRAGLYKPDAGDP